MKQLHDRAWRCENWVIWVLKDWTESGWINLCVTQARSRSGIRRTAFSLCWNGERFALGVGLKKLRDADADAEAVLIAFLARELKRPELVTAE